METIVAVAVLIAAASCLLTVATARRLADHDRRLASLERLFGGSPDPFLDGLVGLVGRRLPRFERLTTGGDRVSDASLAGRSAVVAFLSPQCPACVDAAGELAAAIGAGELPRALAVVRADEVGGSEIVDRLGRACDLVLDEDGSLATAFEVSISPAILALDRNGVVTAASSSTREIVGALVP
jgi:hypothetical protein